MRRIAVMRLGVCVVLAMGCSDGSGGAGGTGGNDGTSPVVVESSRSESGLIGSDGGTIAATASNGTAYTLEIPANAISVPTTITMTPVREIDGLGLSGGLAGAVQLAPAGLVFATSALLHIQTVKTAGGGQQLAGFAAFEDFSERRRILSASDDQEIVVLVPHFSLAGAGFGTTADLATFTNSSTASIDSLTEQIVNLPQPWDAATLAQGTQIGHDAFSQIVEPALQTASNDVELLDAISIYDRWLYLCDVVDLQGTVPIELFGAAGPEHTNSGEYQQERVDAGELAADALVLAIGGNNDVCGAQGSLEALANVFFWQSQATKFGVEDQVHGLDMGSVLDGICARVVLVSSTIPTEMTVGFPNSVDMNFAIEFDNGSQQATNFEVTLLGSNLDIQHPIGFTGDASSGSGRYTSVITALSSGEVFLDAHSCLVLPGKTVASPVCGDFHIAGNGIDGATAVDLNGEWTFAISYTCSPSGSGSVGGPAVITQSGTTFTGTWSMTGETTSCGGLGTSITGTFGGSLSGFDVLNFRIDGEPGNFCFGDFATVFASGAVTVSSAQNGVSGPLNGTFCRGEITATGFVLSRVQP